MKHFILGLAAAASLCLPAVAVAQDEEPIITIRTDAYKEIGPSNAFRIMIGSSTPQTIDLDCGWGSNEYDIEKSYVDPEAGISGTWIPITVSEEGLIRIWGDASLIDAIDLEGGYVTEINMPECVNLEVLGLEHNALRKLDLEPFDKLFALYLTDNPFTPETPFKLEGKKPYLSILEIDIIDNIDPTINFSSYPALQAIDCYHTLGLTQCDVSGCPNLLTLSLEMTSVESLDVTNNPKLLHLNISESRITEIDLSNNPMLEGLLVGHVSGFVNKGVTMKSLDISKNPNLNYLSAPGNLLTSLDISNNPKIQNLYLQYNSLTSLDLSKNKALYSININYNNFDFTTLPAPEETWGEYFYRQKLMPVARALKVGETLDMSSKVLRPGSETFARVICKPVGEEEYELDQSYYTYADGKISFSQALKDSVYVQYANTVLVDYNRDTTPFLVKTEEEFGKPSRIASFTLSPGHNGKCDFTAGMLDASPANPRTIYVDFSDGELRPFTVTASDLSEKNNITFSKVPTGRQEITIYVPEEDVLTGLGLNGLKMDALNVTAATELRYLSARQCNLPSVFLIYNRCLEELDLRSNELYELDLSGAYGYEKTMLHTLDASRNHLDSITIVQRSGMRNLNLARNEFNEFDLTNFDNIETLDLSGNKLAGELSLTYILKAKDINLANNNITSLKLDSFEGLERMKINGNLFSMATLPQQFLSLGDNYIYAPQQPIPVMKQGPGLSLVSQNVTVDGHSTSFNWKTQNGTPLAADKIEVVEEGLFRFPDPSTGTIYCEIENEAFPAFTGEDALRTTDFTVREAPTTLVASFTTKESSDNGEVIFRATKNTEIFIDWRGDGVEYIPYSYINVVPPYPSVNPGQTTYAGAEVKVYTYEDPSIISVFSLYEMPLEKVDYSPMTNAFSLSVGDAGLTGKEDIVLPENAPLTEIKFPNNNLTSFPWAGQYPNLNYLSLLSNPIEKFDGSKDPNIIVLWISEANLKTLKFDNPMMDMLTVAESGLETIDLNGLPNVTQIILTNNNLSEIDLTPVAESLHALNIIGNRFTFATYPDPLQIPDLNVFYYGLQADLNPECVDMKVDLSDQANIRGCATEYYWFFGEIIENSEDGTVSGEPLIEGDEYTIENGVTTFHVEFKGQNTVTCVLRNELYPNTYLKTVPMNIINTGVTLNESDAVLYDVFNLQGVRVRKAVPAESALDGLAPGIYIYGGKKHIVR